MDRKRLPCLLSKHIDEKGLVLSDLTDAALVLLAEDALFGIEWDDLEYEYDGEERHDFHHKKQTLARFCERERKLVTREDLDLAAERHDLFTFI